MAQVPPQLDSILDAALDELDDDEEDEEGEVQVKLPQETASSPNKDGEKRPHDATAASPSKPERPVMGPPPPPPPFEEDVEAKQLLNMMETLMQSVGPPPGPEEAAMMDQFMREMQSQFQQAPTDTPATPMPTPRPTRKKKLPSSSGPTKSVEETISHLVQEMAVAAEREEEPPPPPGDEDEDDMVKNLMGNLMGGSDPDKLMDGMMEQLLSKELMYEPMKQVAEKFPDWLATRKDTLSLQEYQERQKQCDCFQQLVQQYETEPNDVTKLAALMQQVQEYGQPPPEIISQIAPGLELDEDGLPKLDPTSMNLEQDCCIL